jgi:predicted glycosyltransferase
LGLETDPETVVRGMDAEWPNDREQALRLLALVPCPTLVIQGSQDAVVGPARGAAVTDAIPDARLITVEGAGHGPHIRDPVRTNLVIRDFACSAPPPRRWARARSRGRRALYVSSPIGLGHARRDVAIARELRRLVPGLVVDWLAQDPVTRVLGGCGERVHPASALLAGESGHLESVARGHELDVFDAFRRMDEILVANFMVFLDVVREEGYDVWIGDEAWEVDYFLHENPELKSAAYVWLSDFVGWLPMPGGGEREAFLTADYNAEMLEQLARYPRVRDRSIFVGDPEDVAPGRFGPGLPSIREWTEQHFEFSGYVTGFDPATVADRDALRAELGYRDGERVCVVTVGGSGVGEHLLGRVIESFPEARRRVAGLRMIVVAGPRIDPDALWTAADGLEVRPYVPDLYRHLAACDLAIVQGGLATTMELTAVGRPFLYFPLERHFEQNLHVRHRLERYRVGRRMDYRDSPPDAIAAAIAQEINRPVDYRPVGTDGATHAAQLIAELL